MTKVRVALFHQGLWDMEKLSMPLACGYLKAHALKDEWISANADIKIFNYGGGATLAHIIPEIFLEYRPDIFAASVFGWNHNRAVRLAEAFRQINPKGWCIFGGTHVGNQAAKEFRLSPSLDILVNGEGERTFTSLLRAYLSSDRIGLELANVRGISFRDPDGNVITTLPQTRIESLDEIPSPFLSGALPMRDANGEFPYDTVTMESNRGCPYSCSFCYWGGATGARVHSFSSERLREELLFFAQHKIETICLCDANFGMLRADETFVDDFISTKARYGFPQSFVTSWAKNKGKRFYDIMRRLKSSSIQSDFTVSLQSLDDTTLKLARRTNMRLNKFEDLCEWILSEGFDAYGELIWGLPGETYKSFLSGYDRLAKYVPRIATYTNLLIPNTEYDLNRKRYGFVTFRGELYDYEYVLAHDSMTEPDNRLMHRFLFLSRVFAEHMVFRFVWKPVTAMTGLTQSQLLLNFDAWLETCGSPAADALKSCQRDVVENLDVTRIGSALRLIYTRAGCDDFIMAWWRESIVPLFPIDLRRFAEELMIYELLSRPVHDERAKELALEVREVNGGSYYVREAYAFEYNIEEAVKALAGLSADTAPVLDRGLWRWERYYPVGFSKHVDNHEIVLQYAARDRTTLEMTTAFSPGNIPTQRHVVGLPDSSRSVARM